MNNPPYNICIKNHNDVINHTQIERIKLIFPYIYIYIKNKSFWIQYTKENFLKYIKMSIVDKSVTITDNYRKKIFAPSREYKNHYNIEINSQTEFNKLKSYEIFIDKNDKLCIFNLIDKNFYDINQNHYITLNYIENIKLSTNIKFLKSIYIDNIDMSIILDIINNINKYDDKSMIIIRKFIIAMFYINKYINIDIQINNIFIYNIVLNIIKLFVYSYIHINNDKIYISNNNPRIILMLNPEENIKSLYCSKYINKTNIIIFNHIQIYDNHTLEMYNNIYNILTKPENIISLIIHTKTVEYNNDNIDEYFKLYTLKQELGKLQLKYDNLKKENNELIKIVSSIKNIY